MLKASFLAKNSTSHYRETVLTRTVSIFAGGCGDFLGVTGSLG
jgi:hypothetical protein